jgi:hypothetical protein
MGRFRFTKRPIIAILLLPCQARYSKNAMELVTIKCYISVDGDDVIRQWWIGQRDAIRGEFSAVLSVLMALPFPRWPKALCKPLEDRASSGCAGLDEILLDGRGYHYRILGFRGPRLADFTMLHPFLKEVDARYEMPCRKAQERKTNVRNNWTLSRDWEDPEAEQD